MVAGRGYKGVNTEKQGNNGWIKLWGTLSYANKVNEENHRKEK